MSKKNDYLVSTSGVNGGRTTPNSTGQYFMSPEQGQGSQDQGASWKPERTSLSEWLKFLRNARVILASCG